MELFVNEMVPRAPGSKCPLCGHDRTDGESLIVLPQLEMEKAFIR